MSLDKNVRRLLLLVGRLGLAAIFIFYSYAKMKPLPGLKWSLSSYNISSSYFAMQVGAYELLPDSASITFAKLLPPFEMLLGLWLLSGVGLRFSSVCTAFLLSSFIFALVWAYVHGLKINCGCGGIGDSAQVDLTKIIEDVLMLAVAVNLMVAAFRIHSRNVERTPITASA